MTDIVKQDNLKLAIGAIVAGCFALSLGDALIKQQSASFVLWQIFVVRSAILRKEISPGMRISAVLMAWGPPAYVEPFGTSKTPRELWVYHSMSFHGEDPRDYEVLVERKKVSSVEAYGEGEVTQVKTAQIGRAHV